MSQIDRKTLGIKLAAALQKQPSVAAGAGVPPITKVAPQPAAAPVAGGKPATPAVAPAPQTPHAQAAAQAIQQPTANMQALQQPTAADIMTPQGAQQTYGGQGLVPSENVVAKKVAEERLLETAKTAISRTVLDAIRPLLFR